MNMHVPVGVVLVAILAFFTTKSCVAIPPTVPYVNTTAYLGLWYQVYADPVVTLTFERDAVCVTAQYGLEADGKTITVFNQNRVATVTGPFKNITGTATVPNPSQPGQLLVNLEGVPVPGLYWIFELGPLNAADEYDYSIVSDNLQLTLFVLTRDVERFYQLYDIQVQQSLTKLGFTYPWNKPQQTLQQGCTYQE